MIKIYPKTSNAGTFGKSFKIPSKGGGAAGVALDLLQQFGPQALNFVSDEYQEIAKLDNFAQSLKLDTIDLYKFNMVTDMAGGDPQEPVNVYRNIEKLNDGDPKNQDKLKKIADDIKILGIITPEGLVRKNFLTELDKSDRFHGLPQQEKNNLYNILGIPLGGGLDTIFAKGKGALSEAAENNKSLTPDAAQIRDAHRIAAFLADQKYFLKSAGRVSEKAAKESVKDMSLGQGAPYTTVPSQPIDKEDVQYALKKVKPIIDVLTFSASPLLSAFLQPTEKKEKIKLKK